MKVVEGGAPNSRERAFADFCVGTWDIDDEEQVQEAAHCALSLLTAIADEWNPYWILGLMETAKIHIYRLMEEDE